ncbi:5-(carboxyamino)imidazole ribonucleotide mutase [Candidatus Saccharibacteria bacterium]|nr:MAG: 5-(carboxyamino)imidazole ribonucleotide mutase [Candidatus Saccharibacteria bacterium]
MNNPVVGIIMGSDSDLDIMSEAAKVLDEFGVTYEVRVVSAHRTPDVMEEYAATAAKRGLKVIIAGAGGSAHLPGMTASHTVLPVIAVPVKRDHHGHEAFWSSIKMPPGVPLATMPENGAKNGALMTIEILSLLDTNLSTRYAAFRQKQHDNVIAADTEVQQKGWQSYLKEED